MFGFIKNIFGTSGAEHSAAPQAAPRPVKPPVTVVQPPPPPRPVEPLRTGVAVPRFRGRMERVLLNLKTITDRFPPDLRGLIISSPAESVIIAISVDGIVEQLAGGRLEISLAELRRISPIHIFSPDTSLDDRRVEIPLNEVLPKLDPALLMRRSQRTVELPSEIAGVFESKRTEPEIAPVSAAPSATLRLAPEEKAPAPKPEPPPKPQPVPETVPPLTLRLAVENKAPEPPAPPVVIPPSTPPTAESSAPLRMDPPVILAEPKTPVLQQPAVREPTDACTIAVPLCQISSSWPESIRNEIASLAGDSVVEFPKAELENTLKRGLVAFPWGRLRGWITPVAPSGETPGDEISLNVPIPVVAPLFMAGARPIRTGTRVQVDESIPELFAAQPKKPIGEASPVSAAPASVAVISQSSEAHGVESRGPMEIVERACALNGISGAIVASGEGLVIAAKLPPELNAETLGAFIPQVFSRLEQAVEPMRIGDLKNVMFTAGDRPWHILKSGTLFFAAMGRPNELLPGAQLKMLATQLARLAKP